MYAFLVRIKPRSVQADKTYIYKNGVVSGFKQYYPTHSQLNENLYAISYYFHRQPTQLDADNMSKPIWDALNSIVYEDDKSIKLRISGLVNMSNTTEISAIDITKMPDNILGDLLGMLGVEEHIVYIEIGRLNYSEHYLSNLEK